METKLYNIDGLPLIAYYDINIILAVSIPKCILSIIVKLYLLQDHSTASPSYSFAYLFFCLLKCLFVSTDLISLFYQKVHSHSLPHSFFGVLGIEKQNKFRKVMVFDLKTEKPKEKINVVSSESKKRLKKKQPKRKDGFSYLH